MNRILARPSSLLWKSSRYLSSLRKGLTADVFSSDSHNVATAECSQLLNRNPKTCEKISDLSFVSVRLRFWGSLDQNVSAIPLGEYFLHVEPVSFFLPAGICPRVELQNSCARKTNFRLLRYQRYRLNRAEPMELQRFSMTKDAVSDQAKPD